MKKKVKKKKIKIKNSPAMIVGRIFLYLVLACIVAVPIALLIPCEKEMESFETEQEVRESKHYMCARTALLYILEDDTITELKSISYISGSGQFYDGVVIKYKSDDELIVRYFAYSYNGSGKLKVQECNDSRYRTIIIFDWFSIFDPTSLEEPGERVYNEFATDVILSDARRIKNGDYIV